MLTIKSEVTSVDGQGDAIVRACDAHNMIVLNDGLPTFISSLSQASSTIDLSIASRNFGLLASVSTLQDLYGSDHFPVSISVVSTSPSMYRFTNRFNLSDKHKNSLLFIQGFLLKPLDFTLLFLLQLSHQILY